MNFVDFEDILLISFKDGSWQLRYKHDLKISLHVRPHDVDYGNVRKVSLNYEKKAILSSGADGTMFVYKVDLEAIK